MTSTTTAGIIRPVKAVDDLGPKGNQPFPTGAFVGTIEDTKVRGLPFLAGRSAEELAKQGYTSEDVEVLSLQIGSNNGLEGQEVGNKKFFTPDIVVRDGEYSITSGDAPESAWQLARSQDALTAILVALGQAEMVPLENGESGYAIANEAIEALMAGEFNGQQIGFVVTHRTYATREDKAAGNGKKSGVQEQVKNYFAAV